MNDTYLNPTEATVAALMRRDHRGPITMLNLLRFREIADYSEFPALAPADAVPGREAFEKYIEHTLPFLRASGGELVYLGSGAEYLVGPAGQGWDMVMLVKQSSVQSFFAFATDAAYLAGIGHRTAAVRDSRILPLADITNDLDH